MLLTALRFSHQLLKDVIDEGDHAIDATMGNGNDTRFLAELVGKTGRVYAFDVQEQAIKNTYEKLAEYKDRSTLFLAGHETIDETISIDQPIKAAIFNLGYLPNSDKKIITLPETTKHAMTAILDRLSVSGRMILVIYYGHDGGEAEKMRCYVFARNCRRKNLVY